MPYLVGVVLAIGVMLFARWVGLDRDRAFYPTVLTVVASYYALFGVLGGSDVALVKELAGALVFVVLVVVGFRRSLWIVVFGLAFHGVYDYAHGFLIADPGVPAWWPAFCGTYDVVAALGLAWLLRRGSIAK
jgi:hypothetical protein